MNPKKTKPTALDVSKAFLLLSQPEIGDGITNLKIQKLLYYAQGLHLALYGKPFFNDAILAWKHGPVVESVYKNYKKYGAQIIDRPETKSVLNDKQSEFVREIWKIFGQFSAWKLRDMTHSEMPWKETLQSSEISHEKMLSYFKTKIA